MTAGLARPLAEPSVRRSVTVRPAPRREPPLDDERPQRHLSLVGPYDRPLPFAMPSTRRLSETRDPFAVRPTGRGELPDPESFGRRLLVGVLEALAGRRPVQQLTPHLSPSVYGGLVADLERSGRSGRARTWHSPATVRSVRVCEPADGVAELAAVVQIGTRYRAVAARFEGLDGRWRCVRLQLG
ncbi:MAG: Rv3235 family protein [Actinomycetota bacterium]